MRRLRAFLLGRASVRQGVRPGSPRRRNGESGFTLTEMMLSTGIMLAVTVVLLVAS